MPRAKVNEIDIYYEIYGEGFPLIMILGLESNIDWWGRSLLRKISSHCKVIVFDNRGTGRSDTPDKDFTLEDLIFYTKGLMDALDINKASIFGHSMGGYIAQEFALNYAGVRKLILCSSRCGGKISITASPEVLEILEKPRNGRNPEEIAKVLWNPLVVTEKVEELEPAKNIVATIISTLPPFILKYLEEQKEQIEAIKSVYEAGDYYGMADTITEASKQVTQELLDQFCITGSIEEIIETFKEYQNGGFEEFVIGPPYGVDPKKAISDFKPFTGV